MEACIPIGEPPNVDAVEGAAGTGSVDDPIGADEINIFHSGFLSKKQTTAIHMSQGANLCCRRWNFSSRSKEKEIANFPKSLDIP